MHVGHVLCPTYLALTVALIYGLLMCVFQMASRREANAEMSRPVSLSTLQQLFLELETLSHADTLNRVPHGLLVLIDEHHIS